MNGLLSLTGAEVAYLTAAWPEPMVERVRDTMGIRNGGLETILQAGLGSLLERGLVAETQAGYRPGTDAEVVMLGLYTGQASIEVTTLADGLVQAATFFIGPDLRLAAVAAPAGCFDFGIYPADVNWRDVLMRGVEDAFARWSNPLVFLQFRSAAGTLHRIAIACRPGGDWSISDSAIDQPKFQPAGRADVLGRLSAALAEIGVQADGSV
jgi:hypothetical protein